jgi:hypothetical protein
MSLWGAGFEGSNHEASSVNTLASVLTIEAAVFVAALVLLVSYRLVTGEINTIGLLSDKWTREFSPARLQLLVATVLAAGYWFLKVLNPAAGNQLPDVPQDLLLLLGGSHTLYLGSKSLPLLLRQLS